jgi:hypothetical protein
VIDATVRGIREALADNGRIAVAEKGTEEHGALGIFDEILAGGPIERPQRDAAHCSIIDNPRRRIQSGKMRCINRDR